MIFLLLIGTAAMLYAAVGHGGASGYLAIMALYGVSPAMMRPSALLLNLVVAGVSFYLFSKKGFHKWKLTWPFIAGSIPAAFLGGFIGLPTDIYRYTLGIILLLIVVRFLLPIGQPQRIISFNPALAILFGILIGFVSGLIGIGGGIILSPILLLLGWADVKVAAATSALFIWVNSFFGITGIYLAGGLFHENLLLLVLIAGLGALIGGFWGSFKSKHLILQRVLMLVLMIASVKLILI